MMYRSIDDFTTDWAMQSAGTVKLLRALTDASLAQRVSPEGRTLGRIAWHLVTTIGEMLEKAGLAVEAPAEDAPAPATAAEIADAYQQAAASLARQLPQQWTDAMLLEAVPMYGESWARGLTLQVLLAHEYHHRGQLTVLMRQAGLPVPGLCGPAREDWAAWGMPAAE